ncbi:MAG: group 1 glycosyl transferase [Parcubacteria group bacterium Gr01-1014_18]|nr:MAG: group 1 glycosyl transferase [Parcubacteria group bacterium Greene0416_36]TSC81130.1 MAG: group 1 glycosyl transferase [Parcubacteria group bacterium Gr01-1014_18]TSC98453.1 MAG: group 1 glycosyl transferase [Parcubacteria group bacterium Greene1014_20]TSD07381.1 MAG: group 1 glycosyl transferase [Parcubacteria group bacterium Greene0714_2]
MPRILFVSRPDCFSFPAGDTVQMKHTAKYLEPLGWKVDFWNGNIAMLKNYEIIHVFNSRPIHFFVYLTELLARLRKKLVISPIIIDLDEYNRRGRYGLDCFLFRLPFWNHWGEWAKSAYLSARGGYSLPGFGRGDYRSGVRTLLDGADAIVCLSELEREWIAKNVRDYANAAIIPNGVEPFFYSENKIARDCFLCVGKIEPLKNQLRLLEAYRLLETDIPLYFIGSSSPKHPAFVREFFRQLNRTSGAIYIPSMPHAELASFYHRAKVHIQPSWFENAPLVHMEALSAGAASVLTDRGFGKSLFPEYTVLCSPRSPVSIAEAIVSAETKEIPHGFSKKMVDEYSWGATARKLASVYESLS